MSKRSPARAKLHANRVMMNNRNLHNTCVVAVDLGRVSGFAEVTRLVPRDFEVRERSQKRNNVTPKRRRFEMAKRAYIVRRHGIPALEARLALLGN